MVIVEYDLYLVWDQIVFFFPSFIWVLHVMQHSILSFIFYDSFNQEYCSIASRQYNKAADQQFYHILGLVSLKCWLCSLSWLWDYIPNGFSHSVELWRYVPCERFNLSQMQLCSVLHHSLVSIALLLWCSVILLRYIRIVV